jgi:hypothetical protein
MQATGLMHKNESTNYLDARGGLASTDRVGWAVKRKTRVAIWRQRLAVVNTALGFLLLSIACVIYLRYASDLSNLHAHERVAHAQTLALLWNATFFGSALLFVFSLFGLGWGRWLGLAANAGAFVCTLMTVGAMCGPFGC